MELRLIEASSLPAPETFITLVQKRHTSPFTLQFEVKEMKRRQEAAEAAEREKREREAAEAAAAAAAAQDAVDRAASPDQPAGEIPTLTNPLYLHYLHLDMEPKRTRGWQTHISSIFIENG